MSKVFDKRQVIRDILSSNDAFNASDEYSSSDESDSFDESKCYKLSPRKKRVVEWMIHSERHKPHGGILATDMGTVNDKLSIIMDLFSKSKPSYSDDLMSDGGNESDGSGLYKGCTLILCSTSSIKQWVKCIKNTILPRVPDVCVYYGKRRHVSFENLYRRDIVITTVTLARSGFRNKNNNPLFNIQWNRIILDDPQCTSYDFKLRTSRALCELNGISRWALIGSNCIENLNVKHWFGIIKFINYEPFNNFEVWKKWLKNNPTVSIKEKLSDIVYTEK